MDYTYPSIFFAYGLFFVFVIGALFFFVRTIRHGYFGKHSEDVKLRMLDDKET